jgi:circadian clock protein KaiC
MRSIGLRLEPLVKSGKLRFHSARPTLCGLEMLLAIMFREIELFRPAVVIVDPITSLTHGGHALQQSEIAMSSLMDAWLLLQDFEGNGERNRVLYVLKARGMAHSNQVREFLISNKGIDLVDAYIGPSGVLTGASRVAQAAREKEEALASRNAAERRKSELERKRILLDQEIAALRSEYDTAESEMRRIDEQTRTRTHILTAERAELARMRDAEVPATGSENGSHSSKERK